MPGDALNVLLRQKAQELHQKAIRCRQVAAKNKASASLGEDLCVRQTHKGFIGLAEILILVVILAFQHQGVICQIDLGEVESPCLASEADF